jgi:hypothetical protein
MVCAFHWVEIAEVVQTDPLVSVENRDQGGISGLAYQPTHLVSLGLVVGDVVVTHHAAAESICGEVRFGAFGSAHEAPTSMVLLYSCDSLTHNLDFAHTTGAVPDYSAYQRGEAAHSFFAIW